MRAEETSSEDVQTKTQQQQHCNDEIADFVRLTQQTTDAKLQAIKTQMSLRLRAMRKRHEHEVGLLKQKQYDEVVEACTEFKRELAETENAQEVDTKRRIEHSQSQSQSQLQDTKTPTPTPNSTDNPTHTSTPTSHSHSPKRRKRDSGPTMLSLDTRDPGITQAEIDKAVTQRGKWLEEAGRACSSSSGGGKGGGWAQPLRTGMVAVATPVRRRRDGGVSVNAYAQAYVPRPSTATGANATPSTSAVMYSAPHSAPANMSSMHVPARPPPHHYSAATTPNTPSDGSATTPLPSLSTVFPSYFRRR